MHCCARRDAVDTRSETASAQPNCSANRDVTGEHVTGKGYRIYLCVDVHGMLQHTPSETAKNKGGTGGL